MALVTVKNLTKNYDKIQAVAGIDFEIEAGEVFGLLGPNGAGKSTTINMLCAYTEPSGGSISIDGLDVGTDAQRVKPLIGIVPQDLALYQDLNAVENLAFFGRLYDVPRDQLGPRIDELLKMVGLYERRKDRVEHFSGGMKRRLNLAIGLLHRPKLLLLDEPTVGVDPQSRNALFDKIKELNAQGLSLLYTTHYMEEAELLCDRVGIIDQGQIIALDTPQNLIHSLGTGLIHIGVPSDLQTGPPEGPAGGKGSMIADLCALSQVKGAIRRDDTLVIESHDAQRALLQVIGLFNESDTPMTALNILEPNLESVFIKLTGKQLRD